MSDTTHAPTPITPALQAARRTDISRHIGTELRGLSLLDISDADVVSITHLLAERGVLVFRDQHMTLEQQIAASLEKQKFHLLKQIALSNKAKAELDAKIKAAEAKAFEKRQRLGEYNALFMSLENANAKAPRQKLGAREAVMGATPASLATSCSVTAPLPRRLRRGAVESWAIGRF